MFAKATSNLLQQIDPDGLLIPVSRLNDSDKLVPLSLVVKRKRFWFWQQPKHLVSDFTLNDVLTGDDPMQPDVAETDFLKYKGTFGDIKRGKMDAEVGQLTVNVEGKGSSKLQSSFGALKKQEVDVQRLLQESRGRVLDLEHCLIQQTREKQNEAFGLVKERILTMEPCFISEQVQEQGECGAVLAFRKPKKIQVSLNNDGNMQMDSEVLLEIPAHTVVAYSIIELEVKANGEYELCLLPDVLGGFEVDSHKGTQFVLCEATGKDLQTEKTTLSEQLKEMGELKVHIQELADLPPQTRSRLFQLIKEAMQDRAKLAVLNDVLDQLCQGRMPDLGQLELSSQRHMVQTLLDLLQLDGQEAGQKKTSPLIASYMLVNAMEEMNEDGLTALGYCSSAPVLQALQQLVQTLETASECSLQSSGVSPLLEEEIFQRVERLFSCCKVTLWRKSSAVLAEARSPVSLAPLLLCITIHGLASLSK